MTLRSFAVAVALLPSLSMAQRMIKLKPGLVIRKSGVVSVASSLMADSPPGGAVITVRSKNLTLDFRACELRSKKDSWRQRELLEGTGILLDGCVNVTIRRIDVNGFRNNIRIVNCKNVRIEQSLVRNSRAIRMMRNGQPLDTFLNLRDSNAWRAYGAGIWIERSSGCRIVDCKGSGGTIGAALVDCASCIVHDNDFSFCGGWGVAMARTKKSVVSWNHLDFNNRVWGGGWGGDSAALAVADDSDENYFVGNSMTHSGDGFFLSNRNDVGPVDPATGYFTPQGGSDHNVIADNDGSWSPANAFEGTFSVGNVYYNNQANDSGYGFWLGFSNGSLILDNDILRNRNDGIAIEHGKGTRIAANRFVGNGKTAMHLWASPGKERTPFPSTHIEILGNSVRHTPWMFALEGSTDVVSHKNFTDNPHPIDAPNPLNVRKLVDPAIAFKQSPQYRKLKLIESTKPRDFHFYRESRYPKGLQWIQADGYAPRDFSWQPAAYRLVDPGTVEVRLVDPNGTLAADGWAKVTPGEERGSFLVSAQSKDDSVGEERPLNLVVHSEYRESEYREGTIQVTLRSIAWHLRWFDWHGLTYDSAGWGALFASKPLREERSKTIGGEWTGRAPEPGLPRDHFALLATTKMRFPAGRYTFTSLSDDGIRLYVDGKLIIERWNQHGPTPDQADVDLPSGVHDIRVEYCQESGAAVLQVDWHRRE